MTELELAIRRFILKAILKAKGPTPDSTIRDGIRAAWPSVTFTAGDITQHISETEECGLIAGTNDDTMGLVWDLTPKGKIKAQQL